MADESDDEDNKKKKMRRIKIGYGLSQKKIDSFITNSLVSHANHCGIDFIPVDLHFNKPLYLQGPFDCLIHKLYTQQWSDQLLEYQSNHPNVPIIDPPSLIKLLHNRVSMLDCIKTLNFPTSSDLHVPSLGIPNQIVVDKNDDCTKTLRFPIIAKPLIADGKPNSHHLSLVINSNGLQQVKNLAPVVLQEFVNHGGVLFKVYVAGKHVKCVQRKSLPDFHLSNFSTVQIEEGVVPLSQVYNLAPATKLSEEEATVSSVSMPPLDFVHSLATAVREATQLHLFNLDLIRDGSDTDGNSYLVIDINYFPGYAKFEGFEAMITDFFLDLVQKDVTA